MHPSICMAARIAIALPLAIGIAIAIGKLDWPLALSSLVGRHSTATKSKMYLVLVLHVVTLC